MYLVSNKNSIGSSLISKVKKGSSGKTEMVLWRHSWGTPRASQLSSLAIGSCKEGFWVQAFPLWEQSQHPLYQYPSFSVSSLTRSHLCWRSSCPMLGVGALPIPGVVHFLSSFSSSIMSHFLKTLKTSATSWKMRVLAAVFWNLQLILYLKHSEIWPKCLLALHFLGPQCPGWGIA